MAVVEESSAYPTCSHVAEVKRRRLPILTTNMILTGRQQRPFFLPNIPNSRPRLYQLPEFCSHRPRLVKTIHQTTRTSQFCRQTPDVTSFRGECEAHLPGQSPLFPLRERFNEEYHLRFHLWRARGPHFLKKLRGRRWLRRKGDAHQLYPSLLVWLQPVRRSDRWRLSWVRWTKRITTMTNFCSGILVPEEGFCLATVPPRLVHEPAPSSLSSNKRMRALEQLQTRRSRWNMSWGSEGFATVGIPCDKLYQSKRN